jgi:hypothetical protein
MVIVLPVLTRSRASVSPITSLDSARLMDATTYFNHMKNQAEREAQ